VFKKIQPKVALNHMQVCLRMVPPNAIQMPHRVTLLSGTGARHDNSRFRPAVSMGGTRPLPRITTEQYLRK
jgi:hypothetical protein